MQEHYLQLTIRTNSIIWRTEIFDEKLSVRDTEKLVKEMKNPKKPKRKSKDRK